MRLTYWLRCEASGTSATGRATPGDSFHLPPTLKSERYVSHGTSGSRRFGSLTIYVGTRAVCQPCDERLPATRFIYLLHMLKSERYVSHVMSDSRRFGLLTICVATRA